MENKNPHPINKENLHQKDLANKEEPSTEAVVPTSCADARMMLLRHPEELPKPVRKKRL